jgi:hypothetical protein
MRLRRLEQRRLDRPARGVGDVDDAAVRVPAFASEMELGTFGVERDSELDQASDRPRGTLDDELDRLAPIEPGAGNHCVADVVLEGIAGVEHRGDPALRPRGRARGQRAFREYRHRALLRQRQRGGEPGGARADDEHVASVCCHARVMAASGRRGKLTRACPPRW